MGGRGTRGDFFILKVLAKIYTKSKYRKVRPVERECKNVVKESKIGKISPGMRSKWLDLGFTKQSHWFDSPIVVRNQGILDR